MEGINLVIWIGYSIKMKDSVCLNLFFLVSFFFFFFRSYEKLNFPLNCSKSISAWNLINITYNAIDGKKKSTIEFIKTLLVNFLLFIKIVLETYCINQISQFKICRHTKSPLAPSCCFVAHENWKVLLTTTLK